MNSLKTKKELEKDLEECRQRILIGQEVRKVASQFKQLNKKFKDELIKLGYSVMLRHVQGLHKLCVTNRSGIFGAGSSVNGQDLTLIDIERELAKDQKYEQKLKHNLACYDADLGCLKHLVESMEQIPEGSNFKSDIS